MAHPPEELIVEILACLPVKSLLRFKCLSKPLRAIIDNPNFIRSQLTILCRNFTHRKLIFWDQRVYKKGTKVHVHDVHVDLNEDILHIEQPGFSPCKRLYGHCNGLLLLYQGKSIFSVYNPSTRQHRDLPALLTDGKLRKTYCLFGAGLGYDDSIDEYKAFYVVQIEEKVELETHVWVYGLKSNTWRRAQNFPEPGEGEDIMIDGIGYFANGSLHWLCEFHRGEPKIVVFDVRKETCSVVPLLFSSPTMRSISIKLCVLEGCLCVGYLFRDEPFRAAFYIRKKDAVGVFSWKNLLSITHPPSIGEDIAYLVDSLNVLGYSKGGDKILLQLLARREEKIMFVVSYDVKKKSFAKVETEKDPIWNCPMFCLEVESLVSVGGGAYSCLKTNKD